LVGHKKKLNHPTAGLLPTCDFFLYGSEREKEQQYGLGRRRKVDYRTKLYCNVKKGLQEQCVSPVRLEDEVAVCEPLQQHIPEMFIKGESMSITSNNSQQNLCK